MSVYGEKYIKESYTSIFDFIEDISNDINITCLEFNNYSIFLDEYILNENYDIINEGIGDVISSIFDKIKESIKKMIKKIKDVGRFIIDLFRKNKSSEKESDKIIKTINNSEIVDEDEFSKIKSEVNTNNTNRRKINISDFNNKNNKLYIKDIKIPFAIFDYSSGIEERYSVIDKYLHESDDYKEKFDKFLKSTVYDMGNRKSMKLELYDNRNKYMMPKLISDNDENILFMQNKELVLEEGSYYSDFKKISDIMKKKILSPFSYDNKSKEIINKLEKRYNDMFKYAEKIEKKLKYEKDGEIKFSSRNNISQKNKERFINFYSYNGDDKPIKPTRNNYKKIMIENFKDYLSILMKNTNKILQCLIKDNEIMFKQATKLKALFSKITYSQKTA